MWPALSQIIASAGALTVTQGMEGYSGEGYTPVSLFIIGRLVIAVSESGY